jgi:hypothetical protein
LTDDQFALLAQAVAASDGAMEIVEHSVNGEAEANEAQPEAKEPEAAY